MPRYAMTTFLNKKEIDKVEEVCKLRDCSKYKLLRDAVLDYCEACLDGEKQNERGKEGLEDGNEADTEGRTEKPAETSIPPFATS